MFGLKIIQVSGHSMEPTFKQGSYVLLKKSPDYKTGDIVAFKYQDKQILKRITGSVNKSFWVEGDNPQDSLDSTQIGYIPEYSIIGKAILW